MNKTRFHALTQRLAEAKLEGGFALDLPVLLGDAQQMRLKLMTIATARPLEKETLMQFNDRLRAIASAAVE